MKKSPFALLVVAGLALLAGAGCENITTSSGGNPNRVVTGTVNFHADGALPPDAEVVVKLIDTAGTAQMRSAINRDLPVASQPKAEPVPQVLAEQTIKAPERGPIPFRMEYTADDELLRHGLNLEARISYRGRVQMRTVNFRVLTSTNATKPQEVWVEAVAR